MLYLEQLEALNTPIAYEFVHKSRDVKGEFASNDYVTWTLNQIFGPDGWSMTILTGPDLIELSDKTAYVKVTVRLTAIFENGAQVNRDEVGVWPLVATKAGEGGTLEHTAPERFETVLKAAVSDALKAGAERLGLCFRPLADRDLDGWIRGQLRAPVAKVPAPQAIKELYGDDDEKPPMTQADAKLYQEWARHSASLSDAEALQALGNIRKLSQFRGTFEDAKQTASQWVAEQIELGNKEA